MNDYNFKEEEIPFDTLGRFGLTKEMIADLPSSILEEITYGYRSPLLPVSMTDDEGRTIDSRTRFALVRMEDGSVDVVFFPKLEVNPLERFTEEQKAQLRMYKPIIGTMQTEDGESITAFHQLDHETDQILSVPSPVIGHNMQVLAETFRLSNAEINCLKNGEPLSVIEDDDMYTFGIDLERQTGILVVDGDTKQWEKERKRQYEKYNFGVFGCWMTDDNGDLQYVKEENYTEEMWEEMKRNGAKRAAVTHKM
jgi:hypothetical protein